eukprot:6420833-Prymnesium_polylepis.1
MRKRRKSVIVEMMMRCSCESQSEKKVCTNVSVNATVLNVTLRQYVIQKSRPEEPPKAGPSEREIM